MITMKKFLSIALVAVMLCTVALAAAPTVAEFTANNGFFIYENKSTKLDPEVQDPAEMADTANGLQVVHGGYYTSGDNCGGVVSNEKYDLNGFTATVFFEKAPEVTTETDCWVAFDFLAVPKAFFTNNFNVENGGNQGIMNLIRFGKPYIEAYDGVTGFSQKYNSQSQDAAVNNMFSITSGTTLTVKVARTETNTYTLTFSREGFEDFTVPYEWEVGDVFVDGKAHFSVIASCEIAPENGWTYYITDVTNGVELTAEEIAEMEAKKLAAAFEAEKEVVLKSIEKAEEKINEVAVDVEASGDAIAAESLDAAKAALADAKAGFEAAAAIEDLAAVKTACDDADTFAQEAKQAARKATPKEEAPADEEPAADAETENAPTTEAPAEEGGFPVVWVVVAVVVVVIVIAVIVLSKKKK